MSKLGRMTTANDVMNLTYIPHVHFTWGQAGPEVIKLFYAQVEHEI